MDSEATSVPVLNGSTLNTNAAERFPRTIRLCVVYSTHHMPAFTARHPRSSSTVARSNSRLVKACYFSLCKAWLVVQIHTLCLYCTLLSCTGHCVTTSRRKARRTRLNRGPPPSKGESFGSLEIKTTATVSLTGNNVGRRKKEYLILTMRIILTLYMTLLMKPSTEAEGV